MDSKTFCFVCGTETKLNCRDCAKRGIDPIPYYCGRQCQTKDWSWHKFICARNSAINDDEPWTIEDTPDPKKKYHRAPRLLAKRDLEPGEIVAQRKPLLAFADIPSPVDEKIFKNTYGESVHLKRLATCVSCAEVLVYGDLAFNQAERGAKVNKCRVCAWPLHANLEPDEPGGPSACELQHQEECKILHSNGIFWPTVTHTRAIYFCLGILRAVLLPPEKKKLLLALPPPEKDKNTRYFGAALCFVMKSFVKSSCKISIKSKDLEDLIMIVMANVLHTSEQRNFSIPRKSAYMIYESGCGPPNGRILTHDCVPNCALIVGRDMVGTFRTIKPTKKGEPLTLSLVDDESAIVGVCKRTTKLLENLHGPCGCARCNSPDEDGTFLSAVRSQSDKPGCEFVFPLRTKRTEMERLFQWECPCRGCGYTMMTQKDVENLMNNATAFIITTMDNTANCTYHEGGQTHHLVIPDLCRGPFHPDHEVLIVATITMAEAACVSIFRCGNFRPDFAFDLHANLLPKIELAWDKMEKLNTGWCYRYGLFKLAKSLLRTSKLADMIKTSQFKPDVEWVDNEITEILREMNEGSKIISIFTPLTSPFTFDAMKGQCHFYGNYMLSAVLTNYQEVGAASGLKGVKALKKAFSEPWKDEFKIQRRVYYQVSCVAGSELKLMGNMIQNALKQQQNQDLTIDHNN